MEFYYYETMYEYLLEIAKTYEPNQAIVRLYSIRRRWLEDASEETPECIPQRMKIEKNRWRRFVPKSEEDAQERQIRLNELNEIEKTLATFPLAENAREERECNQAHSSATQKAQTEKQGAHELLDFEIQALEIYYKNAIAKEKLTPAQKRGLKAVFLKFQGNKSQEIFATLQPADNRQKDPKAAARRWIREGKALAKKLGLPPLPDL